MAGQIGDGLIVTSPGSEVIDGFRAEGGSDKPIYGQVTGCWAASEDVAKKTVHEIWPNAGVPGELSQELPLPQHFEQASSLVTPEMLAEQMPIGPDVGRYVESVQAFIDAGVESVYFHQVGPDQEGFFRFFTDELGPALSKLTKRQPVAAGA